MSDAQRSRVEALSAERRQLLERLASAVQSAQEDDPVAIVGIGCRFPADAHGPHALWSLLWEGRDAVSEIPPDRWDKDAYFAPNPAPGRMTTRWGGFVRGLDRFDPSFFGIARAEAEAMDPQQRMTLATAWEALEHAGVSREDAVLLRTGVFVGASSADHQAYALGGAMGSESPYLATGGALSVIAGRVAYALNLSGPAMVLDTACSSSLLAVHVASAALRARECDLALAGGTGAVLAPATTMFLSRAGLQSKTGRCRAFDARADGYVRSEGTGIVALKLLSRAVADGDRIFAVIRATGVNQDGRSNGLTAPNGSAQEAVLRETLRRAKIAPGAVQYLEAHGTGTSLGDVVEARAIASVYAEEHAARPLRIGSVKSNLGHLEAAAGVAGLIKVALSLHHRKIPPNLHFQTPNPNIPFEEWRLEVQANAGEWPDPAKRLIAGVSSFGFSGTNVHAIVEEGPAAAGRISAPAEVLAYAVSGHSAEALRAQAVHHARACSDSLDLNDASYTSTVRRSHLDHRALVFGRSAAELRARLEAVARGEPAQGFVSGVARTSRPKLAFVFPGQGSQWLGMARTLLDAEPAFRDAIRRTEEAMRPYVDWSLMGELTASASTSRLAEIAVVQPVLFAIGVALVDLLASWGVRPDAVIGHSMGEVAASCVAGALALEDACKVICLRSRLMMRIRGNGAMAMIDLPATDVEQRIASYGKRLVIAAENGPRTVIVSGDARELGELMEGLRRDSVFFKSVRVDVASHSHHVDSLRDDLLRELAGVAPRAAQTRFVSTVDRLQAPPKLDASYWWQNLRERVAFGPRIAELVREGFHAFVELGAHPLLGVGIEETARELGLPQPAVVACPLRRDEDGRETVLAAVGALHAAGLPVDFTRRGAVRRRVVDLPTYAWQEETFALRRPLAGSASARRLVGEGGRRRLAHALLDEHVVSSVDETCHLWQSIVTKDRLDFVDDHRIAGQAIAPGALFLDAMAAAVLELGGGARVALEAVQLRKPWVPGDEPALAQVACVNAPGGHARVHFSTRGAQEARDTPWTRHAEARIAAPDSGPPARLSDQERDTCTRAAPVRAIYTELAARSLEYGPRFQCIAEARRGTRRALVKLRLAPDCERAAADHLIHPALLDGALQSLAVAVLGEGEAAGGPWVPVSVERVELLETAGLATQALAEVREISSDGVIGDVRLFDEEGRGVGALRGVRAVSIESGLAPVAGKQRSLVVDFRRCELTGAPTPGAWIVIGASAEAEALAAVVRARGRSCVIVPAEAGGPGEADPSLVERYVSALTRALAGEKLGAVVRLVAEPDVSDPARGAANALRDAWALVNALTSSSLQPRLFFITRGARAIAAGERANPDHAALWGFAATLAHEAPELRPTILDGTGRAEDLAQMAEGLLGAGDEDRIACRGGEHFVARLRPTQLTRMQESAFAADGAYIISGGLGGLGLVTAEAIVKWGARHVVLVGRRAEGASVEARLATLRASGCRVDVARADVSDRPQVDALVRRLREGGVRIRGIVHAAGKLDDATIARLTTQQLAGEVLEGKARGAWNLWSAVRDAPPDWLVFYSSAATVLGSPGQANYAAANAFLGALAQRIRGEGGRAIAIAWGPWGEVGQATREDRARNVSAAGLTPLRTADCLQLFLAALEHDAPEVVVAEIDAARWSSAAPAQARAPFFKETLRTTHVSPRSVVDDLGAVPAGARQRWLERFLVAEIAQVLRSDPNRITPAQPLAKLGLDSLMIVTLRNRVSASTGLELSAGFFFAQPDIRALAAAVLERLKSRLPVPSSPRGHSLPPPSIRPSMLKRASMSAPPRSDDVPSLDAVEELLADDLAGQLAAQTVFDKEGK